jgi:hypothetical protein
MNAKLLLPRSVPYIALEVPVSMTREHRVGGLAWISAFSQTLVVNVKSYAFNTHYHIQH